jgi:hypothetical protein
VYTLHNHSQRLPSLAKSAIYSKAYAVFAESDYTNRVTAFGKAGAVVRIPLRARRLTLLQNVETDSEANSASSSMGTDVASRGYSGRSVS